MNRSSVLLPGLMAALFVVVGVVILWLALGLIPAPASSFHVPRFVIGLLGLSFVSGGGLLGTLSLASYLAGTRLLAWLQYLSLVVFMGSFALVLLWIGLGPGERAFSGTVLFFDGNINALAGRCAFGGFGVFLALATLWVAITEPLRLLGLWPRKG